MCVFPYSAATQIARRPPLFEVYVPNTIRHTLGRTPLSEWSVRRRGRDVHNTEQTQETNFHAFCGFRIRDPNKQAAAHARLRPHGHSDWTLCLNICHNVQVSLSVQIISMYTRYFSHIRKRLLFSGIFHTSSVFGFK